MSLIYTGTRTIDSREVDGSGWCKASALLGHLQEAATQAAIQGGFSRQGMLESSGGVWMLLRLWYRLERPLRWGEELTVQTWHRGGKGASLYRDYDLYVGDAWVGECVSLWVLATLEGRLIRLSKMPQLENTHGGERCKELRLPKLALSPSLPGLVRRTMHYSDTDINGHVNNTRYADFACDVVGTGGLELGQYVSQLQLDYLAQCRPGEELLLRWGEHQGSHLVQGEDGAGQPRFAARLTLERGEP